MPIYAGSNLVDANLSRANLQGANLRGATYNEATIWPQAFSPTRAGAIRVK